MKIEPEILHDLKTERPDVLPPLSMTLRLVPILFYLTAFGAVVLAGLTVAQIRQASGLLVAANERAAAAQTHLDETKVARTALEGRAKRASDVLRWVEGAVNVQPLAVAIARSTGQTAGIVELALTRGESSNRQIQLAIKLQAMGTDALEPVIEAIRESEFRPFSAQQSQAGNEVSYEATLIRQVDRAATEAEETVTPSPTP